MSAQRPAVVDGFDGLAATLEAIRHGRAVTRPDLVRVTGLGRNVVAAHLKTAMEMGLVETDGTAPSSGGRAPELWRFVPERGHILTAFTGAGAMELSLTDLAGNIAATTHVEWPISEGPERTLARISEEFDRFLKHERPAELCGIGIALPGPINNRTERPIRPPIMPGWDNFDVEGWLTSRYNSPVWVDNDVNLMALGHLALEPDTRDLLYIKAGTGIGAGIISGGRLHRGHLGAAGDIGHVRIDDSTTVQCRCGRVGCLEAFAGGWAVQRDAVLAQSAGRSTYLTEVMQRQGTITPSDVGRGAMNAEPTCVELIASAAVKLGKVVAILVSVLNPSTVVIGGGIASTARELFLGSVRRTVLERVNDLASEDLRIVAGRADQSEGTMGCARMVTDNLLSPSSLASWPAGAESARPTG